ncbi:MAG: hypothetical protein ACFCU4_05770 [Puniceicoccaceae bacterium]
MQDEFGVSHQNLMEAIRSRKPDTAAEATRQHHTFCRRNYEKAARTWSAETSYSR